MMLKIKQLNKVLIRFIALLFTFISVEFVYGAVSEQEANELGKTLTPFGGVMAGNEDGSIPPWTGGGEPEGLADEKPVLKITSQNFDQHSAFLTKGMMAMFKKYPDTFYMNIYPTHRTHQAPDWVNENTKKNAVTTNLAADGEQIDKAWAGLPFPIAKSGQEAIWNHRLRWRGVSLQTDFSSMVVYNKDKISLDKTSVEVAFPFYYPERGNDIAETKLQYFLAVDTYPSSQAGSALLVYEGINASLTPRQAWAYSPGERRVRRVPNAGYDTPLSDSHGIRIADEVDLFNGMIDRYDWTLKGKKEMYVPYNNVKLQTDILQIENLILDEHPNPEYLRYEKHRVWVLEANLKEGKRHLYSKRELYLDEDNWGIRYGDLYDRRGELWRVSVSYAAFYPLVPVTWTAMFVHQDLRKRAYFLQGTAQEQRGVINFKGEPPPKNIFTPAALRRKAYR